MSRILVEQRATRQQVWLTKWRLPHFPGRRRWVPRHRWVLAASAHCTQTHAAGSARCCGLLAWPTGWCRRRRDDV